MKNELLEKFRTLLQTDDIASIKQEVRDLMSEYNSETAKEKQLQFEQWKKQEDEAEENAFVFEENAIDETFEEVVTEYKERVKEHGQKIAAEQQKNLQAKKEILEDIRGLIQDEENIAKAFTTFNELTEKWESLGNVPGNNYQEVQDQYRKLKDNFYYNMSIYRQLRENDLLRNEKSKVELIEKIKSLKSVESIRECDTLLREYRNQWDAIGPATRENYKELGDEFFGIYRDIVEKIQSHYQSMREEREENLEKKKKVVIELKEILQLEISNHGTWVKKTQSVLDLQNKWKEIGFGPKKENEELWQEFRGLCDLFFEKKHQFYSEKRGKQEESKSVKLDLIEKAKQWETSTDWKKGGDALISLQKQWKEAGATFPSEEQKLWSSFRTSCDKFFNARKEYFDNLDGIQIENLKAKETLIEEIKNYEITGNKNQDLESLRSFSSRWKEIGYIPKKSLSKTIDAFNKALDSKYDELKLKENERSVLRYKNRVDNLKSSPSSANDIRREKRLLYDKIDRLKNRIIQYENNINFFSGSGAESMRKEVEKKINSAKREIDEIKAKLNLLND